MNGEHAFWTIVLVLSVLVGCAFPWWQLLERDVQLNACHERLMKEIRR